MDMSRGWTVFFLLLSLFVLVISCDQSHTLRFDDNQRPFDDIVIVEEKDEQRTSEILQRVEIANEIGIEVDDRNLFIEIASRSLDGVYINPKVLLGEKDGLRGLFAVDDIGEEELLAKIPKRYFVARSSSSPRMQRILEVIKKEVFEDQHLRTGEWINVDWVPWEIHVTSILGTIGLAEDHDTPERVSQLEQEFQELTEETLSEAVEHIRQGLKVEVFDGLSDSEIAAKWFFLGSPPYSEYARGRGPLLEMPSIPELSTLEKLAMDWSFPELNILEYSNIDKRVYDYFSTHLYGQCFTVPGPEGDEEPEEVCIRQLSFKFFQYMCAIAARYCFSIASHEAGQIGYVSLVNHGYDETMHWDATPEEFILRSNRPLSKGSEILISYGGMNLRDSVLHYGFFDQSEKLERRMVLPFENDLSFGPVEESLCQESVLAGIAALETGIAYFPYTLKPSVSPHAKLDDIDNLIAGARHSLSTPEKLLNLHPYQRRMIQCKHFKPEIVIYSPGYLEVDSWRLLRLLHTNAGDFASLNADRFYSTEVECRSIDTALMLIEARLATSPSLSAFSNGDALVAAVNGMLDSIEQLEELLRGHSGVLPSNTDDSRSHGVLNALQVANAEVRLLRAAMAKLVKYNKQLDCDNQ